MILPIPHIDGKPRYGRAIPAFDERLGGELRRLAQDARFSGKVGSTLTIPTLGLATPRRLILTGLGPAAEIDTDATARAWGAAVLAARTAGASSVSSLLPPSADASTAGASLTSAAIGARLALYRFDRYRGAGRSRSNERHIETIRFVGDLPQADADRALETARATADAVLLARDLVNEPGANLTPAAMADHAVRVAEEAGLEVEVLGPTELAAIGAGAILGVGSGSDNAPRLIRLRYRPAGHTTSDPRVVGLVGKCITFDTGGYSIKTYDGMLQMKGDMAGGAAVLGVMSALRDLGCPVAVDGTICAAENMISGHAFRPGDVLTAMNGITIEVLSTDAEGRLVLADGMVDAARRGATELIDLATLTGGAVVALGEGTSALFASDDALAERLLAAAAETGERAWRMPLIEALNEKIAGTVGDVKNSGGRGGSAITAALFLERFREGLPWAHFDIAGSARLEKSGPIGPKGASGVGVRTLLAYLAVS